MFIRSLRLINFRNYLNLDLEFDEQPKILLGNNAAGKSNILEAIYLLSTSKSVRVEKEEELILEMEDFTRVEGLIKEGKEDTNLLVTIQKKGESNGFGKRVFVNGIPRRVVDFVGHLPAVIFYPADINMVTGSPSLRRWHLDLGLAQVNSSYKASLTAYEQFLTARNRVLKRIKEGEGKIDELDFWTEELVKNGQKIQNFRQSFFEFIPSVDTGLGNFSFEYKLSLISEGKLRETVGREIAASATLIGPHRDDFLLSLNGKHLAHFGSRGEQRTATLAFELVQLEYMAQILGKRPILLLDDVFSELDASHRAAVVSIVGKQQTIIATVELEHVPRKFLESAKILQVESGKIIP